MNELDIARKIANGELSSPQPVPLSNYWLLDMRISGTGFAYREKSDSYILRLADDYLTDDVLAMCNGLPVIVEHPENPVKGVTEDSHTIGTVFYPYIKGVEIWGITKIWDEQAIQAIIDNEFSTSCSFRAGSETINIDGTEVKKDLPPQSANHVAILQNTMGVWDKCDPEAISINTDSIEDDQMAVINDPNQEDENGGGDDVQQRILSMLDQIVTRLDALENAESSEEPAPEAEAAPAKPVEDSEPAPAMEKEEPKPEVADPAPKDDAEATLAEHANRLSALESAGVKDDSEAEKEAEVMDDSMVISGMLGTKVVKPFAGEKSSNLKRRTLKSHIENLKGMGISHAWQGVNVDVLDDSALSIAYSQTVGTMKGIQPKASADNPLRSFVKKGHGGLSNENHFALADSAKGAYFNQF
ncbi:Uncharacterised conserved protein UCP029215 [uncultured Caudovirales phage]|uniref:Uncharacterized conserved protein UCP029215 n=1 Tax=uncultured Caudovirales phage TaxID=2100421 RepID=A0A6J5LER1_9CAUD|nr:Uncharacterised conserved protein UCP029215 [uncultured Caudovirales phage]